MKKISIILAIILFLFSIFISINAQTKSYKRIIIDPGHGGRDGGALAYSVQEANLNLEISLKLKKIFEEDGFEVDLTRENELDLCEGSPFIKRNDMNERVNKINSDDYLFCVSIHQNTFSNSKYRGAQVFYNDVNSMNKDLADSVQESLRVYLNNTNREIVNRKNIYLLNKVVIPIIIVECGFMTNPEEIKLLQSYEYQKKLAYSIWYGCIRTIDILN